MENAENAKKSFHYRPLRDIISTINCTIIAIIMLFPIKAFVNALYEENPNYKWINIIYICVILVLVFIIGDFLCIYSNTFQVLTISAYEITYRKGWLTKETKSIAISKIRSCSKSSGILQRACGTMDISITTAGDSVEIYFSNIADGESAFRMISTFAMMNEI